MRGIPWWCSGRTSEIRPPTHVCESTPARPVVGCSLRHCGRVRCVVRRGDRGGGRAASVGNSERPRRACDRPADVHRYRPTVDSLRREGSSDRGLSGREQSTRRNRRCPRGSGRSGARGRGCELFRAQGCQPPCTRAGNVVELRIRECSPGRVDDHPAGGEERIPGRPRTRRPLQDSPGTVCGAARTKGVEEADPRALPQHRLSRKQCLRAPGRRRDLLRNRCGESHDRAGDIPGGNDPGTVELRPDPSPRAFAPAVRHCATTCGGRRPDDSRAGDAACVVVAAARGAAVGARTCHHTHVLLRGCEGLLAQQVGHPRHHISRAVQRALPWRSAHPDDP